MCGGGVITTLVCSCRLNLKMHVIFYCKQHSFEPFNMHLCIMATHRSPLSHTALSCNVFLLVVHLSNDGFFFSCAICVVIVVRCIFLFLFYVVVFLARCSKFSYSLDSAPFMRWCVFIAHKIHDIIVPRTWECKEGGYQNVCTVHSQHCIQRFWLIEYLTLIFLLCVEKLKFYSFKHLHSVFFYRYEWKTQSMSLLRLTLFFSLSFVAHVALFHVKCPSDTIRITCFWVIFCCSCYKSYTSDNWCIE